MTLHRAINLALQYHPAIRSGRLDRQLQQESLRVAETEFHPKGYLGGEWGRQREAEKTSRTSVELASNWKFRTGAYADMSVSRARQSSVGGREGTLESTLRIVQPLLKGNGSVAMLALRDARMQESIGRLEYVQQLNQVVVDTVTAYLTAVQARSQVDLANLSLERSLEIKEMNQAMHRAGRIAALDLLQPDLDVAQNELALAQARNAAEQSKRALLQLFGLAGSRLPVQALVLADDLPGPVVDVSDDVINAKQALVEREDLVVAETLVTMSKNALRQAENNSLPQLDLVVEYQPRTRSSQRITSSSNSDDLSDSSDLSNFSNTNDLSNPAGVSRRGVMLQLQIPLDRNTLNLERSSARASLQKATWALEDLRTNAEVELDAAFQELQSIQQQLILAQKSLELARKRLDSEVEKMKAGRSTTFELSSAQGALKEAQSNVVAMQLAVPRAKLQLDKVTGKLLARWVGPQTQGLTR